MPRRARYLIPQGLPRRGEVAAACAVAILVAHLLLAQLTLVLAVVLAAAGRAGGWRRWWLLAPAFAGVAWTLAVGPGNALAGFTAGPSGILGHLAGEHLAGQPAHWLAGFAGASRWLPRQFPVALIAGAAEAALVGWLDWLHTDEWAARPPRPGLVAAGRRAVARRVVQAGGVVTRDGAALGVVPATGAVAELRWAELAHGALIIGAAEQDVTLAGLQVVHAALRRRKPVIVLDPGVGDPGSGEIARALHAACTATGTPLLPAAAAGAAARVAATAGASARTAGSASGLWGRDADGNREPGEQATRPSGQADGTPGRAVRERSAALLPASTAELAGQACAELAALAGELRRIGVDGDALIWVPRGERVPARALAGLVRDGWAAGLAVMVGTTSPAAATGLAALAGAALIYRVTDLVLAGHLAPLAGTRLLPRSLAVPAAAPPSASAGAPAAAWASAPASASSVAGAAADLVPAPAVPAQALLALGPAEFVLAVRSPQPRVIMTGQMVPARLPRVTGPRAGANAARGPDYGPDHGAGGDPGFDLGRRVEPSTGRGVEPSTGRGVEPSTGRGPGSRLNREGPGSRLSREEESW